MAMENQTCTGDLPTKTFICRGFPIATFDSRSATGHNFQVAMEQATGWPWSSPALQPLQRGHDWWHTTRALLAEPFEGCPKQVEWGWEPTCNELEWEYEGVWFNLLKGFWDILGVWTWGIPYHGVHVPAFFHLNSRVPPGAWISR